MQCHNAVPWAITLHQIPTANLLIYIHDTYSKPENETFREIDNTSWRSGVHSLWTGIVSGSPIQQIGMLSWHSQNKKLYWCGPSTSNELVAVEGPSSMNPPTHRGKGKHGKKAQCSGGWYLAKCRCVSLGQMTFMKIRNLVHFDSNFGWHLTELSVDKGNWPGVRHSLVQVQVSAWLNAQTGHSSK